MSDGSNQAGPGGNNQAGPGHNAAPEGNPEVWTFWQKKRTFVRALEGTYGEVYKGLYAAPRVYHGPEFKWKGGPQFFAKEAINPGSVQIAQSIECHINVLAPNATSQKHGHMNSAVLYILSGKGKDIHDGHSHPYEAGDACIVENGCVHQHVNTEPAQQVALVMKAKPLFLFMHMLFQKVVEYPSSEPAPGGEGYVPPGNI